VAEAKAAAAAAARKAATPRVIFGSERVLPPQFVNPMLDSIVKAVVERPGHWRGQRGAAPLLFRNHRRR